MRTPLVLSAILMITGFAAAYVQLANSDYLLVIHFDSFRGVDFFGNRADVFGILWVGLAINAVNFLLSYVFYEREKFLSLVISWFSVFFSLLILIAVSVIISIN